MELKETSALVVGGSSGLGRATVEALVSRRVHVVILARDEQRGAAAAAETGASFLAGSATHEQDLARAVERAEAFAPLRSLVVCSAMSHAERTVGRDGAYASAHSLESFRAVVEANLIGTFNCARIAATALGRNEPAPGGQRGAIVLTSSLAAKAGQVGQAAYAAAKAGILGMVLPIARDLAPLGIRVNAIVPGAFDTPAYGPDGVDPGLRDRLRDHMIYPVRMGIPAEFAELAIQMLTNDYLNAVSVDIGAGATTLPR